MHLTIGKGVMLASKRLDGRALRCPRTRVMLHPARAAPTPAYVLSRLLLLLGPRVLLLGLPAPANAPAWESMCVGPCPACEGEGKPYVDPVAYCTMGGHAWCWPVQLKALV
jgi:hypothetical protein